MYNDYDDSNLYEDLDLISDGYGDDEYSRLSVMGFHEVDENGEELPIDDEELLLDEDETLLEDEELSVAELEEEKEEI